MTADPIRERAEALLLSKVNSPGVSSTLVRWDDAVGAIEAALRESRPPEPAVDPLLVEAREIAAQCQIKRGSPGLADATRNGVSDDGPEVTCALAALRSRPKEGEFDAQFDAPSTRYTGLVKGTAAPDAVFGDPSEPMARSAYQQRDVNLAQGLNDTKCAPPEPEDEWAARAGEIAYRIEKDDPMTRHILRDELIRCHREGFNEALATATSFAREHPDIFAAPKHPDDVGGQGYLINHYNSLRVREKQ